MQQRTVRREVNFVDVYAERGDERLYAEAKGPTTSPGLDVDTLYGQLLRRMKDPKPGVRYSWWYRHLPLTPHCACRTGCETVCQSMSTK